MIETIPDRLKEVSETLYDGNDSAFARDIGIKPQSMYRYMKGKRVPGTALLNQMAEKGLNIHWIVTGEGEMEIKHNNHTSEPNVSYGKDEPGVSKMLNLIVQRLQEVEYPEEKKVDILKQTLNEIVIEQNQYFVDNELKSPSKD